MKKKVDGAIHVVVDGVVTSKEKATATAKDAKDTVAAGAKDAKIKVITVAKHTKEHNK